MEWAQMSYPRRHAGHATKEALAHICGNGGALTSVFSSSVPGSVARCARPILTGTVCDDLMPVGVHRGSSAPAGGDGIGPQPVAVGTRRVLGGPGSALPALQVRPLQGRETAPDADLLAAVHGGLQALLAYGTPAADRLGAGDGVVPVGRTVREEDRRIERAARGFHPPAGRAGGGVLGRAGHRCLLVAVLDFCTDASGRVVHLTARSVRGWCETVRYMTLTLDLHPIFRNEREVDRAVRAIIFEAVRTKATLVEIIPGK